MSITGPGSQQLRAEFMEALYAASGRTNGLYTGLWDELKRRSIDEMGAALAVAAMHRWDVVGKIPAQR